MTNDRKIVIARSGAALAPCRICRVPNLPEDLSPNAVCKRCFAREGAAGGWTLIPDGMALVPVQVIQQANLGAALAGELQPHQVEGEPIVLTLRRLLAERAFLIAELADPETPAEAVCAYCGAAEEGEQVRRSVKVGTPPLWYCRDEASCCARVNAQIHAKHAAAGWRAN
jgi:hypothetical protein